jgi:hypothetical protein
MHRNFNQELERTEIIELAPPAVAAASPKRRKCTPVQQA